MKTEKQIINKIKKLDRERKKAIKMKEEFAFRNSSNFYHKLELSKITGKIGDLYEQRYALAWVLEYSK